MTPESKKNLYLIDGSGFIFRAFYALPPMTRSDGTPVNAVLGFTNMLIKILLDMKADYIVVVFDAGRKTFRHDIYPAYKANRPAPPEELIPQFPLIREACQAFQVPHIEIPGYEADDIIATYTKQAQSQGIETTIISSDKDLMQLVQQSVSMYDPMKDRTIGPDEVFDKFGVSPDKVIEVQALAGDATDNIPGVPGIGLKTASFLIREYGDLNALLAQVDHIKQPKRRERLKDHAEKAKISRALCLLKNDVPVCQSISAFSRKDLDVLPLKKFLQDQNFASVLTRLEKKNFTLQADEIKKDQSSPPDYELVQTSEDLQIWVNEARKKGEVAIDTETNSLDPMIARLVGISLAVTPGKACYIPLGHRPSGDDSNLFKNKPLKQIPRDVVFKILAPLLADPSVLKIGQNIKYDMLVLQQYGLQVSPIEDTMVMSYVLDGSLHGHGMDELARIHLEHTTIAYEDVVGKGRKKVTFDEVPLDIACPYAAEDADITLQLQRFLKPKIIESRLVAVYETLERPLIDTLREMEYTGIKVDAMWLQNLSYDFAKRLAGLEKEIFQLAGGQSFNIGSPKQLGIILFEELKFPGGKKGKTGAYSTGAEVIEDLVIQGHKIAEKILDWRLLSKLKSTYSEALIKQINPKTGRIHTSYGMTTTSTGRLSSNNPNLQNIPIRSLEGRKIRQAFIASAGHKLISFDYSQIELRLLAHIADIEKLKKAFRDGVDIHVRAAAEVFGIPEAEVTSDLRSRAKAINFGIIYGISAHGLSRQLRIPHGEAATYIKHYLEKYPGIASYMEKAKELAKKQGYVETLFGRRCHTPYIFDKNYARRNFGERQAINAPLQGSNADIIKLAMVAIPRALKNAKLDAKMLLQVHDELIFEAPDHQIDEVINLIKPLMQNAAHLSIPLVVDVGVGQNWGEIK